MLSMCVNTSIAIQQLIRTSAQFGKAKSLYSCAQLWQGLDTSATPVDALQCCVQEKICHMFTRSPEIMCIFVRLGGVHIPFLQTHIFLRR